MVSESVAHIERPTRLAGGMPGSAAPVWLVLDSRGQVVSVAGSQSVADSIKRLHESHGFGPYRIEQWAVRRDLAKTPEAVNAN